MSSTEEDQTDAAVRRDRGEFVRTVSGFRNAIGDADFPAERGRYHLFVALNCPWCHRVVLARNLLGLGRSISMDVAFPGRTGDKDPAGPNLWEFNPMRVASLTGTRLVECTIETGTGRGFRLAREIYAVEGSSEQSVPILYDKKTKRIVNNESAEIIRMFNTEVEKLGSEAAADKRVNLRPEGSATRRQTDELNDRDQRPFLTGSNFTEADLRLFPTLYRHDPIYFIRMKLNGARILDYPNLWRIVS